MALVLHDADDVVPLGFLSARTNEETLADGALAWKGLLRQDVVDDDAHEVAPVVRIGEGAAREELSSHRLEVSRQDDVQIRLLKFRRVSHRFLFPPTRVHELAVEWKWIRGRHAAYARNRAELVVKLPDVGSRLVGAASR